MFVYRFTGLSSHVFVCDLGALQGAPQVYVAVRPLDKLFHQRIDCFLHCAQFRISEVIVAGSAAAPCSA